MTSVVRQDMTDFAGTQPVHTRPFWEAAARGEFVLERCTVCRKFAHPPLGACRSCGGPVEFEHAEGRGVIYSATKTYYQAIPASIRKAPYWVAVVDLDVQPGLRIVVPVEESADELIRPEADVRIVIREVPGGGRKVPVAVVEPPQAAPD